MPPAPSIVVNKSEVENDSHLKSVIKKYFKKRKFMIRIGQLAHIVIADIEDLSVKSISGTTFLVDIKYRAGGGVSGGKLERATAKIEKTVDSYKVISFDRKR